MAKIPKSLDPRLAHAYEIAQKNPDLFEEKVNQATQEINLRTQQLQDLLRNQDEIPPCNHTAIALIGIGINLMKSLDLPLDLVPGLFPELREKSQEVPNFPQMNNLSLN